MNIEWISASNIENPTCGDLWRQLVIDYQERKAQGKLIPTDIQFAIHGINQHILPSGEHIWTVVYAGTYDYPTNHMIAVYCMQDGKFVHIPPVGYETK